MTIYINGVAKADGATKEFFAPAGYGTELSYRSYHPLYAIDANGDLADIGFYVPHDFTSLVEAVVVIRAAATATHRLDFIVDYGAVGENLNNHHETLYDQDFEWTNGLVYEIDLSAKMPDLAAGDFVGIDVSTLGVNTANIGVLGVRFKYS